MGLELNTISSKGVTSASRMSMAGPEPLQAEIAEGRSHNQGIRNGDWRILCRHR